MGYDEDINLKMQAASQSERTTKAIRIFFDAKFLIRLISLFFLTFLHSCNSRFDLASMSMWAAHGLNIGVTGY